MAPNYPWSVICPGPSAPSSSWSTAQNRFPSQPQWAEAELFISSMGVSGALTQGSGRGSWWFQSGCSGSRLSCFVASPPPPNLPSFRTFRTAEMAEMPAEHCHAHRHTPQLTGTSFSSCVPNSRPTQTHVTAANT
jgi:hypothetical protein